MKKFNPINIVVIAAGLVLLNSIRPVCWISKMLIAGIRTAQPLHVEEDNSYFSYGSKNPLSDSSSRWN